CYDRACGTYDGLEAAIQSSTSPASRAGVLPEASATLAGRCGVVNRLDNPPLTTPRWASPSGALIKHGIASWRGARRKGKTRLRSTSYSGGSAGPQRRMLHGPRGVLG